MPKVLFFAEGATLAHVARPLMLARALDAAHCSVTFARPKAFAWLTARAGFRIADLPCQDASVFARRLAQGRPLYDYATLTRYVADDLALIESERPDLIIGDFRLSLSVSARLPDVPYITLCDAYWSPERPLRAPLPVLGFTRFTPIPMAEFAFRCVSGFAMRLHAIPLERLRARFGLASLGFDLRRCYTDADLRLFANFPALFPEVRTGPEAAFIGPIAWSPEPEPEPGADLDYLDEEEPLIYVTMGSSGNPAVLTALLPVLAQTGKRVIVATAGKSLPPGLLSDRIRAFEFLPGDLVCRHASLVICNGGSPTTNQALAAGVPVLGIAQNMDQFLNMRSVCDFGAGIALRSDRAGQARLRAAVAKLFGDRRYAERARALARSSPPNDLAGRLATLIEPLLSRRGSAPTSANLEHATRIRAKRAHP